MHMFSSDGKAFGMYASWGCEKGIIFKVCDWDEDFVISLVSDIYEVESLTGLKRLQSKWKRILSILKNKE